MTVRTKFIMAGIAAVALLSSLAITGCEELAQAATIRVPITLSVSPASDNPAIPTTNTSCYDMTTEKDFMDNKDKIEGGSVKEAFFRVTSLDNPTFTSGLLASQVFTTCAFTLTFDAAYGDTRVYNLGTFTNVNLGDLMASRISIPVNADFVDAIKLIPRRPLFCFHAVYGPLQSGPASAVRLEGKLDVTIDFEVNPL